MVDKWQWDDGNGGSGDCWRGACRDLEDGLDDPKHEHLRGVYFALNLEELGVFPWVAGVCCPDQCLG